MVLKIIGLGFKGYFTELFNIFDCCVVILSLVDMSLTFALENKSSGGGLTALRAFRLLRVFKIAKHWQ